MASKAKNQARKSTRKKGDTPAPVLTREGLERLLRCLDGMPGVLRKSPSKDWDVLLPDHHIGDFLKLASEGHVPKIIDDLNASLVPLGMEPLPREHSGPIIPTPPTTLETMFPTTPLPHEALFGVASQFARNLRVAHSYTGVLRSFANADNSSQKLDRLHSDTRAVLSFHLNYARICLTTMRKGIESRLSEQKPQPTAPSAKVSQGSAAAQPLVIIEDRPRSRGGATVTVTMNDKCFRKPVRLGVVDIFVAVNETGYAQNVDYRNFKSCDYSVIHKFPALDGIITMHGKKKRNKVNLQAQTLKGRVKDSRSKQQKTDKS